MESSIYMKAVNTNIAVHAGTLTTDKKQEMPSTKVLCRVPGVAETLQKGKRRALGPDALDENWLMFRKERKIISPPKFSGAR